MERLVRHFQEELEALQGRLLEMGGLAEERVRAAVFELPRVHREVIALCDLEELSYATVASILGCPIGTVRSRLSRARALLASRLQPLDPIEEDEPEDTRNAGMAGDELGVDEAALSLSCRGSLT